MPRASWPPVSAAHGYFFDRCSTSSRLACLLLFLSISPQHSRTALVTGRVAFFSRLGVVDRPLSGVDDGLCNASSMAPPSASRTSLYLLPVIRFSGLDERYIGHIFYRRHYRRRQRFLSAPPQPLHAYISLRAHALPRLINYADIISKRRRGRQHRPRSRHFSARRRPR